ncbi:nucleophile aminohydrolase, partial [Tribonema minus]
MVAALLSCLCSHATAAIADGPYDKAGNVFSPQGKLLQSEYARLAVNRGATCVGMSCSDGTVLAIRKLSQAKTPSLKPERSTRRIYRVGDAVGVLPAGLSADGRFVGATAAELVRRHRASYGEPLSGRVLAVQLGVFLHMLSLERALRPLATSALVACCTEQDCEEAGQGDRSSAQQAAAAAAELWLVDVSGDVQGYVACCVGQHAEAVMERWRTNKYMFDGVTCRQALSEVASLLDECGGSVGAQWE